MVKIVPRTGTKAKQGQPKRPSLHPPLTPDDRPAMAATAEKIHVAAVLTRARTIGLLAEKGGRISGRVSPALIERAKARTGLTSDTDLVEFALANVALDDHFSQVFRAVKATVDSGLDFDL